MDKLEIAIIKGLQDGLTQNEISERLKKEGCKPNSISSIEKRLNKIKESYDAKSLFHLACILHNKKIIKIEDSRNGE